MNNELLEEKAQLYALGILPESEKEEFENRIREDRATQALVHEYQQLTEFDASGDERNPSFQVYAGIMDEIDDSRSSVSEAPERKAASPLVSFFAWGGWAAAACVAAVFGAGLLGPGNSPEGESDIVVNNLASPRIVAVQTPSDEFTVEDRMLELAGLAEAYWFSREGIPSGQLLDSSDTEVAQLSGGFTIFDRQYNIGFIAVENLPREAPEKTYHVWAKTKGLDAPIRAGTLPIGDQSRGLFFFDLTHMPEGTSNDSLSFFVTEEESAAPQRPSPIVVLSDV
ncbi:anti-sigma factor domain-containing protein [Pelagicoccus mobilis]|uniref:Anti-sigma factor n=1 Tax=Pelagicoccus mobilis TaxID=415221 RepID=A0A934VRK2_9BACT|nr:anti-sigma factor [Pelagicoccus mobilis]MBK1879487.1 anti-sigma factor [Pelagicoccus mobilis]